MVWGDWIENIDKIIAEGDQVMVHWISQVAQQDEYFSNPPTYHQVTLTGIHIRQMLHTSLMLGWCPGSPSQPSLGFA